MAAMVEWPARQVVDDLAEESERRQVAVRLYLGRLARLVRLAVVDSPVLSAQEQRQLRTRAVVGAIEALTALDAGSHASDILRAARCDGTPAAPSPMELGRSAEARPAEAWRGLS
jgi:hypothetical protein